MLRGVAESNRLGLSSVTYAPTAEYLRSYGYDLSGNRTTLLGTGHQARTVSYVYNGLNQLVSEDSSLNAEGASYAYDANGSQTSVTIGGGGGTTTSYLWSLGNRLAGIDHNGDCDALSGAADGKPGETTYTYDSNGVRVAQSTRTRENSYQVIGDLRHPLNPPVSQIHTYASIECTSFGFAPM